MNWKLLYLSYIAGALLTLAWKVGRWIYADVKAGKSWKQSLTTWLFEPSADNAVSWAATIGIVWIGGSVYISQGSLFGIELPLPLDYGIAFFLGGVLEIAAPNLAKTATQKILDFINNGKDQLK
jgi:hypothetical protein